MKQRGFGWIEIVIVLAVGATFLGVLFGGIHMWNNHMDAVRSESFKAGRTSALNEVADRDNKALAAAVAKTKELGDKVVALQGALTNALVDADNAYQKGIADGNEKKESVLADLRTGRLVLRDPGRPEAGGGCSLPDNQLLPGATAGVGGDHAAKGATLSGRLSDFLVRKFTDADNDLRQLAGAQDAVIALQAALAKCRVK